MATVVSGSASPLSSASSKSATYSTPVRAGSSVGMPDQTTTAAPTTTTRIAVSTRIVRTIRAGPRTPPSSIVPVAAPTPLHVTAAPFGLQSTGARPPARLGGPSCWRRRAERFCEDVGEATTGDLTIAELAARLGDRHRDRPVTQHADGPTPQRVGEP